MTSIRSRLRAWIRGTQGSDHLLGQLRGQQMTMLRVANGFVTGWGWIVGFDDDAVFFTTKADASDLTAVFRRGIVWIYSPGGIGRGGPDKPPVLINSLREFLETLHGMNTVVECVPIGSEDPIGRVTGVCYGLEGDVLRLWDPTIWDPRDRKVEQWVLLGSLYWIRRTDSYESPVPEATAREATEFFTRLALPAPPSAGAS